MKMKKVLMILISLAVVFAMAGVVSADDNKITTQKEAGNTEVKYRLGESYEVIIPSAVTFQDGTLYKVDKVNVTKALISNNNCLKVNISSGNCTNDDYFRLANSAKSYIAYNITNESSTTSPKPDFKNNDVVLTVNSGTTHPYMTVGELGVGYGLGGYVELNFTTTQAQINQATLSGDHIDILKFIFWVEPISP